MRFLFLHLPKTAGTSIIKSLGTSVSQLKTTILAEKITAAETRNITYDHYPTWKLIRDGQMDPDYLENTFIFAGIRNAWDRFRSLYYYKRIYKKYSPSEAVDLLYEEKDQDYSMWNPYEYWLRGIENCHFIRYESLQKDFNTICETINIPLRELAECNLNQHYPTLSPKEFYQENPGIKERIFEYYAEDIERFNQTFPY